MSNEIRKAILLALLATAVLSACAPGAAAPAPAQVQQDIATSVFQTVEAQNGMATAVAQTLSAQAPAPTATLSPTPIALDLPTADTTIPTATPFVVVPPSGGGGGTGGSTPKYACSVREVKPKTNTFKQNDPIDVVWIITNTGTAKWPSALDLELVSSTVISSYVGQELPPLKPGDSTTISFEANAPAKHGFYGMQFKVQGGLCFPALNIEVIRPPDP
jgi:hypothetical protein